MIRSRERLGLFAGPDREADRILALGDPLLGSTVTELASNPVSVNAASQVTIRARLTDGRQLILRADPSLRATRETLEATRSWA
jgi:hypothetical protein